MSKLNPIAYGMASDIYNELTKNKFTSMGTLEKICERYLNQQTEALKKREAHLLKMLNMILDVCAKEGGIPEEVAQARAALNNEKSK